MGYTSFEGYATAAVLVEALRRAGRELSATKIHAAIRGLKARVASMDIDFTGGAATRSRLVEMVHISGDGRFVR